MPLSGLNVSDWPISAYFAIVYHCNSTCMKWFNIPDENQNTTAHFAAHAGSGLILELLFQLGVNLDARNASGQTVAHILCQFSNIGCLQFLLKHRRIDPSVKDDNGLNALDFAIRLELISFRLEVSNVVYLEQDIRLEYDYSFSVTSIVARQNSIAISCNKLVHMGYLKLKICKVSSFERRSYIFHICYAGLIDRYIWKV